MTGASLVTIEKSADEIGACHEAKLILLWRFGFHFAGIGDSPGRTCLRRSRCCCKNGQPKRQGEDSAPHQVMLHLSNATLLVNAHIVAAGAGH
ncbi:MAG: hypothetical protein ACRYGK_15190 [Janthinobacterium lividum]